MPRPYRLQTHLLFNDIRQRRNKFGVIVYRLCPNQFDPDLSGNIGGLDVEVIEDLHVVADKPNGGNDNVFHASGREVTNYIADIRLKPRVGWTTASALIGEHPVLMTETLGNETR